MMAFGLLLGGALCHGKDTSRPNRGAESTQYSYGLDNLIADLRNPKLTEDRKVICVEFFEKVSLDGTNLSKRDVFKLLSTMPGVSSNGGKLRGAIARLVEVGARKLVLDLRDVSKIRDTIIRCPLDNASRVLLSFFSLTTKTITLSSYDTLKDEACNTLLGAAWKVEDASCIIRFYSSLFSSFPVFESAFQSDVLRFCVLEKHRQSLLRLCEVLTLALRFERSGSACVAVVDTKGVSFIADVVSGSEGELFQLRFIADDMLPLFAAPKIVNALAKVASEKGKLALAAKGRLMTLFQVHGEQRLASEIATWQSQASADYFLNRLLEEGISSRAKANFASLFVLSLLFSEADDVKKHLDKLLSDNVPKSVKASVASAMLSCGFVGDGAVVKMEFKFLLAMPDSLFMDNLGYWLDSYKCYLHKKLPPEEGCVLDDKLSRFCLGWIRHAKVASDDDIAALGRLCGTATALCSRRKNMAQALLEKMELIQPERRTSDCWNALRGFVGKDCGADLEKWKKAVEAMPGK